MVLRPPRHGGIDGAKALLPDGISEKEILDFSISINPLGPPPGLREVLVENLNTISRYPEISSDTLTEGLALYHGLSPDHVIVGNGTADLLFSLLPQFSQKQALIPYPTFIEYERVCGLYGWAIRHIPPVDTREFTFDVQRIVESLEEGAILFLCQPNNPTGRCMEFASLETILDKAQRMNVLVALDEAFLPFTDFPSAAPWVRKYEGLVVLRSMTKSFAVPGLRLGYAVASPGIIKRWKAFLPPWNVNILAQAAGVFCLEKGKEHMNRTKHFIREEREWISSALREITFLDPLPSDANFLLIYIDSEALTASDLYLSLAERGILVRHCGSFRGMGERHIRVGLKSREKNRRLVGAIEAVVEGRAHSVSEPVESQGNILV